MLSPYRVLDLTDEKGLLCGKLLGDLSLDKAILVRRHITSQDVIDQLFPLIILREMPEHDRSDNGSLSLPLRQ